MDNPQISIILATIQRSKEIENFLHKLQEQHYKEVEVIIVDQNRDGRLVPIIDLFKDKIPITRITSQPGLSIARNSGLQLSKGEILAFPDDDCWYPPNLLSDIMLSFNLHPDWDGITVTAGSGSGEKSIWKWDQTSGRCSLTNVWQRGISATCFLRRNVIDTIGDFDEELGLGSSRTWQSGEETDYLIRAIQGGFHIEYLPDLKVFHPDSLPDYTEQEIHKAYLSGCGMGHVLRKHSYPLLFSVSTVMRPLFSAVRASMQGDLRKSIYFKAVARGRWEGLTGK